MIIRLTEYPSTMKEKEEKTPAVKADQLISKAFKNTDTIPRKLSFHPQIATKTISEK